MVGDKVSFSHCSLFGVIIIVTLINAAVWGTENQSTVTNLRYFVSKIYTKKNTTTAKLQYVNDHDIYRSDGALELYVQMYALECCVDRHKYGPLGPTILKQQPCLSNSAHNGTRFVGHNSFRVA